MTSRSRSPTVSLPRRSEPAGVTDLDRLSEPADVRHDPLRFFLRHIDMEPSGGFLVHLDGFQDVLLAFFAESFQVAQLAVSRQRLHLLDGRRL